MAKKLKKKKGVSIEQRVAVAAGRLVEKDDAPPVRRRRANGARRPAPAPVRRKSDEITARMLIDLRVEADLIEVLNLKVAAAKKRRDSLIVRLADRGVSEREIGRQAKVTGPRVNQIYHGTGRNNGRDSD